MNLQRLMFGVMYRVGFTPWEGHRLPARLRQLVEGPNALPPGGALDVGCGTGDTSIYLARHGWNVTAIDFVKRALARARVKTDAAGVTVQYLHGDATKLASYHLLDNARLVVDSGCLHGLPDEGRTAYVRDLTAIVPSGARLIIAAFLEGKRRGPRGISKGEIERRFSPGWKMLDSGVDLDVSNDANDPIVVYDLTRL